MVVIFPRTDGTGALQLGAAIDHTGAKMSGWHFDGREPRLAGPGHLAPRSAPGGGSGRIVTLPGGGSGRIVTLPGGGSGRIVTLPGGGSGRTPTP